MNPTIELLKSHRSIRKFTEQTIDQEVVDELIRAGQAAATSSFIQACTTIQVNQQDNREKLATLAGNQAYVASAPVFLVFCADMQRHQLVCDMHQAEMQSGFTEQFITASVDCALFAQNVVVGAESLGLGIVYIGGLRNNIESVANLLKLPHLVYPLFGLCLGYPDQDPEVKPRLPLDVVLKQECYSDTGDRDRIRAYDEQVEAYYSTRTGGTKQMNWSGQISQMLIKESRPHILPFLQERGFIKK